MKKINLILLFYCITLFSSAQSVKFDREIFYKDRNYLSIEYNGLQQTNDTGYVSCRGVIDTVGANGFSYAELIKTNKGGIPLWTKRVLLGGVPDSMMQIGLTSLQAKDKGYLVGVPIYKTNKLAELVLVKTDSLANLKWSKKYVGEGASTTYCINQTTDKGYIVCGSTIDIAHKQYAYIFKTDSLGNYTWGKKCLLGTDTVGAFYSVIELPGQGYVAAGNSGKQAMAVKFDLNGNLLWDEDLGTNFSRFYSVIKTSDNNLVFAGIYGNATSNALCLAKFNQSGSLLWLKGGVSLISYQYYFSEGWSLKPLQNSFIFSGYVQDQIPTMFISKIDLNGNIIWSNGYRSNFESFGDTPTSITTTFDGGLAATSLVGIIRYGVAAFSKQLTKTDSMGNICGSALNNVIGLSTINYTATSNAIVSASGTAVNYTPTLSNAVVSDTVFCETPSYLGINQMGDINNQINIYPNPTQTNFTIETNYTDKQTLQIFDVNGKIVLNQTITGKTNIDVTNLAEGVYNLCLINLSEVVNKRLVIVR